MRILSIALGGCLKGPPIAFGLTGDTGGHLTYLWGAAEALAERPDVAGVEVVTRLIDDPVLGPDYARPVERISAKLGITRVATANRAYLSKEAAQADRPAFIAALIDELAARETLPDIVHAHFADAAEVAIAVRRRFGIPFVFTAHSLGFDKQACGLASPAMAARIALEDRAIAQADAIIASSRDEAERQLMQYPSADAAKIHRVAPGAVLAQRATPDPARARRLVEPFLRDPGKPILLSIARPVHKKNLPALVDLFAQDEVLRRNANLVIVAGLRDGPDSGEAEQRAVIGALLNRMDAHDLYGKLALPKRHAPEDVASLYALARETGGLFINSALTEPYGLTLTEAAHHGLPVVATCNGGAADIVRELGHGAVADPADPRAFADAIRGLLTDHHRWASASHAGAMNARALSWDSYAGRFVEIAETVLRRDARPVVRADDLLLCDIDDTLTGCRKGAGELIRHLQETPGRVFGIATGRSVQEAKRILSDWRYPPPSVWVTSVGSEIYWYDGGRLTCDGEYADHLRGGWQPEAIASILDGFADVSPQPEVEQRRFKRSWFASDPAVAMRVRARLDAAGLGARVIFSHGRFLDILPARGGKGAAMRWVAKRLGLPMSAVFAAGDSGNDLDMLEACPNAILVGNHSAELSPLIGRPGVHLAGRHHAGGVLEVVTILSEGPKEQAA